MERDQIQATQEKFVLEEAQRRESRERGDKPWTSRLFHQDPVTSEWTYKHKEYKHIHTYTLSITRIELLSKEREETALTASCIVLCGSIQPWDPERCLVQFEKDGVIQTHEKTRTQRNSLSYSHSWASQQKVGQTQTQTRNLTHF